MWKILTALIVAACFATPAEAQTYVRGHWRSNGTYVQPHRRSYADGNFYNNWSTYPNVNPYTGAVGTRRTPPARSYYRPAYPTFDYGWGFSPGYENFARQNAEIRGIQRAARGW